MKFRMHKLASALAITLLVVALTLGSATAQQEQGKQSSSRDRANASICLLVEEGFVSPALTLASLGFGELSAGTGRVVVFRLEGGSAQFEQTGNRLIQSTVTAGVIELPPIKAGRADDESVIRVLVDGEEIIEGLRLITIRAETINEFKRAGADGKDALRLLTEHFAILGLSKSTNSPGELVVDWISLNGAPVPSGRTIPISGYLTPWWPGQVIWYMTDPKKAGYSYLPEHASSLSWASPPWNLIDGIYNKNWGSYVALKIPDHCTAHVYQNWMVGFCDPVTSHWKGKIRWVTPGQGAEKDWPVDPLR